MAKNKINSIYKDVKKISKEILIENNNNYKEKVINYCFESQDLQMYKEIKFNAIEGAIVNFDIQVSVGGNVNFKIYLNNILMHMAYITDNYFLGFSAYVCDNNVVQIEVESTTQNDFKILLNLKGCIKDEEKSLSNLKYFNNNIAFIKNRLLSKNTNILTITNYINNISHFENDKYIDVNYNFDNMQNSHLIKIYNSNGDVYLKNENTGVITKIENVAEDYCVISYNDGNCYLIEIREGLCNLLVFDSSLTLIKTYELSDLKYLKAVKVKSISSDSQLNIFWLKSNNGVWYLIDVNLYTGVVNEVRNFVKCEDVSSYYVNGVSYVFQLLQEGVKFDIFDSVNLFNKKSSEFFYNTTDAFLFDNVVYLVNNSVVQEVNLE